MKIFKTTFHTIQLQPNQWYVVETFHILSFSLWCQLHGDESCDKGGGFLYEQDAQRKKRELQKKK